MNDEIERVGFVKRLWRVSMRWSKRLVYTLGTLFVGYLLLALIGLIPVNNKFEPAKSGVEIFVFSGQFHSDIILPLRVELHDWMMEFPREDFFEDPYEATHVAIGWGDRNFYLHTPTWSDLEIGTAAKALLFPSETVMHVEMTIRPEFGNENFRSVKISFEQYESMVKFISKSFKRDAKGMVQRIEDARYGSYDAFYEAEGNYHAFRTCNCWAGEAMQAGGIRVGRFTPLPKSMFMYLPAQEN